MRVLATALILLAGPGALLADGRSDLEILRARCGEQERQIRALEVEIESLHSQLALERRRSRGVAPSAAPASPLLPEPVSASYTVMSGDTLSSIARRYRTSAELLMKTNGIEDPTRLRVGQQLSLPIEATASTAAPKDPTPAPAPAKETAPAAIAQTPAPKETNPTVVAKAAATGNYEVKRGDTLYGIARKHKMDMADLKALNPKVADKIIVGQRLVINASAKLASEPTPSLQSSTTQTISTRASGPAAKKVEESKPKVQPKSEPRPQPKAEPASPAKNDPAPTSTPAPAAGPAATPALAKEEAIPTPAPRTISSIIVMDEVSLGDLAAKHGTTTDQLNALNNWNYKSSLVLARGSEVYVPGG